MLLQINAIQLEPTNPFEWASGLKSPIYCDNRKLLSYPKSRNIVRDAFVETIKQQYPDVEIIAGVATGAIAHGMLVADMLNLPFIYVRSEAKKHGLENMIEGEAIPGKKVVVIEDLISTGGSSLKAVEALRNRGMKVLGLIAIFTYGFNKSYKAFENANCPLSVLSNYEALINVAIDKEILLPNHMDILEKWQNDPENWTDNLK